MRAAGFRDVRFIRMTFDIVALHLGNGLNAAKIRLHLRMYLMRHYETRRPFLALMVHGNCHPQPTPAE
jgi:hypothetical protein